jgi:cytosine/adenosine deaminase-related metal-dependent hydrolase
MTDPTPIRPPAAPAPAGTVVPLPGEGAPTPVVPEPTGPGAVIEPGPGGGEAVLEPDAEPQVDPVVDLVVASPDLKVVEDEDADRVDLVVVGADLVVTMDDDRRELQGGWVACRDGFIVAVGNAHEPPPRAERTLRADGCLVTPGLINTHHHIYQNLTRAYLPATSASLFDWLTTLYPRWALLDEEGAYLSAWVGLAELALGGCTTSTDHLYVHPAGGGDLLGAEIEAARELGVRFHPTRGSMSRSQKDGGLPPDEVVQDDDTILAASAEAVAKHHDPAPGAMVRIALAPCSPFSVTPELMRRTAELAEQLDVRLHTHLAEDPDEDAYCLETYGCRPIEHFADCGWGSSRAWVAHCIYPNQDEIARLAAWGTGVAHCPSSNMMIGGGGIAPVVDYRRAGVPVGLGCDGSASTDSATLWMEARNAMLLARQRGGPTSFTARDALEVGTLGSAACLGRQGELGVLEVGAVADLVAWKLDGLAFAGALSDPVEALLRCGPVGAHHTVVAGRTVVEDGRLLATGIDDVLRRHRQAAARMQGVP